MKNLNKNTKRVLSFGLALLMALSTMFVGVIQAKADTTKFYYPYYDAQTEEVVGAPEVGTVLSVGTTICGTVQLGDDVSIVIEAYDFVDEIGNDIFGTSHKTHELENGDEIEVSQIKANYADSSKGWVVHSVEYREYTVDTLYKEVVLRVYPNVAPVCIEEVDIELNWEYINFVWGDTLEEDDVWRGFFANECFDSEHSARYMKVKETDGEWQIVDFGDFVIEPNDAYAISVYLKPATGYYFGEDIEVTTSDYYASILSAYIENTNGDNYGDSLVLDVELGTGEEISNAIEGIVPPTTDDEEDPVTPPTTDDEEDSVVPPTTEEDKENDYSAKLENEADVETKIELTDAEKEAIANGEELEVVLSFKDAGTTATTEEQKAIEKELGVKKIGTFLEIDLTKKIGTVETEVSETTGLVAITFELPKELVNTNDKVTRTYSVMRYHDGKVDVLGAKYDAEKGTITFETDKFSTYAVVYEDTAVATAPATGDSTNIAMYVMLFVCGAGIILVSRKQNRI